MKLKMTLANRITIVRLACIPVYVGLLLAYGKTVHDGAADNTLRLAAASLFITVLILDIVDGAAARLMRQTTVLGSILDPVADKAVVISSLVILSIMPRHSFAILVPSWFTITVLSRDIILITCSAILFRVLSSASIKPRIIGKAATFFNAFAIAQVLTGVAQNAFLPVAVTGVTFTVASGVIYLVDGVVQFNTPQAKQKAMERHPKV
jgi:cardiolipin synthase